MLIYVLWCITKIVFLIPCIYVLYLSPTYLSILCFLSLYISISHSPPNLCVSLYFMFLISAYLILFISVYLYIACPSYLYIVISCLYVCICLYLMLIISGYLPLSHPPPWISLASLYISHRYCFHWNVLHELLSHYVKYFNAINIPIKVIGVTLSIIRSSQLVIGKNR